MGSTIGDEPRLNLALVGGIAEYRRICDEVAPDGDVVDASAPVRAAVAR